jgi:hypothetical protein
MARAVGMNHHSGHHSLITIAPKRSPETG